MEWIPIKKKEVEFLQYLKQTFKTLSEEKKKMILTGDFNVNLMLIYSAFTKTEM